KARSIRNRAALASWLYAVAYKVATRARAERTRRRKYEKHDTAMTHPVNACEVGDSPDAAAQRADLGRLLDDELSRIPEKYRAPIVLCYLEGRSNAEVAQILRWPEGTVSGRLARGREMLRGRLARRGVVLSAAGLTANFPRCEAASVP